MTLAIVLQLAVKLRLELPDVRRVERAGAGAVCCAADLRDTLQPRAAARERRAVTRTRTRTRRCSGHSWTRCTRTRRVRVHQNANGRPGDPIRVRSRSRSRTHSTRHSTRILIGDAASGGAVRRSRNSFDIDGDDGVYTCCRRSSGNDLFGVRGAEAHTDGARAGACFAAALARRDAPSFRATNTHSFRSGEWAGADRWRNSRRSDRSNVALSDSASSARRPTRESRP